ncbi:MAG: AarF/ABC1/UbiB kinase family protein, partial [Pseudomonadota bacterium]
CLRDNDCHTVKQSFAEFCCYIIEPFKRSHTETPNHAHIGDLYDWRASRLLRRAGKKASKSLLVKGFVMPPQEFMLLVRKLTGVFTFVSTLGAQINSAHLLEQYIPKTHH